jgi:lysophospholipase L1-like esterase
MIFRSQLNLAVLGVVLQLLLNVGSTAVGQECDEFDLITTKPAIPVLARQLRVFDQQLHEYPSGAEVILIGDSLFQRWPDQALERYFRKDSFANYGIGADRIQNILYRLESIKEVQPNPELIMLWAGTNNLGSEDKPCAVIEGMRALVSTVREKWPLTTLRVVGVLPRGAGLVFRDKQRKELNELLNEWKFEIGYQFVDVSNLVHCSSEVPGWRLAGIGDQTCSFFLPDNLHLNPAGYLAIGRTLFGL